ncbi:type VII secretion-associated serine protease [Cellulomonas chitinilytica]|uniref:Type VII secretion-associated serine protease n=1 Tax=Cellulomonas chitinilytica TaxID=398759 RepID=A0A919NZR3_9CELL|nr:S8 family serine peptidase [Cellulomonas chitinilytica]GIG20562.1 type VII secretion-associated serine protease [Cellulomonas chitinilytica]
MSVRPWATSLTAASAMVLLAGLAPAAHAQVPVAATECDPATRQLVADPPPSLATLAAESAWSIATGAGVLVAVVDSGVDTRNDHLSAAVVPGADLVGRDVEDSGRTDTDGHGTAVAGQIAARPVDGSGLVGLARDATILPVRVFYGQDDEAKRDGTSVQTDRIAAGITYAVAHGATIVNVSLSSSTDDPALRAAVADATAAGALVVASAGNRAADPDAPDGPRYPAAYPGVLGVTATDADGHATDDSFHGPHVDVAAPGVNVLTTFHAAGDCMLAGGAAASSWATAYVSAAAALVAERHPDESPAEWAFRLEVTAARDQPAERDDRLGWGVVRPTEALLFVDDGSAPGPDSPTHARPVVPAVPAAALDTSVKPSPLAGVRSDVVWWVLAGVTGVLLVVLAARLAGYRGRRR